ncbi:hypothetical protein ACFL6B_06225 [Thermodesulfobacteriota bacterium]
MKNNIIMLPIILLFLNGCSAAIRPFVEQALIEDERSAVIFIYYLAPNNFVLKLHSASISIDGQPYFFLKSGEHIKFFLSPGTHKFEVSGISPYFDHKETIDLNTDEGQSYYLKTYPIFEGLTFIPYWFIPLPAVDIRFKLFVVDEDKASKEISGNPVNPKERVLRDW